MRLLKRTCLVFALVALAVPAAAAPAAKAPTTAPAGAQLLHEMNRARGKHGLRPLARDLRLERAARAHSRDMLARNYFAHGNFIARMMAHRVRGPLTAENIGWGVGSRSEARAIVAAWLASPAHRANLLRPGFRRVGVGALAGSFSGHAGARVVTANFAGT